MTDYDLALGEADYLLLTWFFNLPPELCGKEDRGGDMMGSVIRPSGWPVGSWGMRWRYWYYRDARIWDHEDRKNWFGGDLKNIAEAEVETFVRNWLDQIILGAAERFRASIDPEIFRVGGDVHKLRKILASGPRPAWMHSEPSA